MCQGVSVIYIHIVYTTSYCIHVYENFIHTFCKIFYQSKPSMIPSADSSFGHSLSGTLTSNRVLRGQTTLKMIFEWQSHDRDCITSESRARATGTKHGVHEYPRKNVGFALFARIYLFCFVSTPLVLFCYYDFFFLLKSNTTFGPYLHYTGEIRKRSSVHTKPVTKIGSFPKTLFTPKEFENPGFEF